MGKSIEDYLDKFPHLKNISINSFEYRLTALVVEHSPRSSVEAADICVQLARTLAASIITTTQMKKEAYRLLDATYDAMRADIDNSPVFR